MTANTLVQTSLIKKLKAYFQQQPVKEVYLFGSFARGEQGAESDLDIMISFRDAYKATLFDLIAFKNELRTITGYPVDIVQKKSAYPHILAEFERDKIALYE